MTVSNEKILIDQHFQPEILIYFCFIWILENVRVVLCQKFKIVFITETLIMKCLEWSFNETYVERNEWLNNDKISMKKKLQIDSKNSSLIKNISSNCENEVLSEIKFVG